MLVTSLISKIYMLTGETVAEFQYKYRTKKYYQNKHNVSPLRNLGSFRCCVIHVIIVDIFSRPDKT